MKLHSLTSVVLQQVRDSIVASIPACHAGDRGSIPRHGSIFLNLELHFVQQYPMPGCFGVVHVKWGEVYGEGGTNTFVTLHPTDLIFIGVSW